MKKYNFLKSNRLYCHVSGSDAIRLTREICVGKTLSCAHTSLLEENVKKKSLLKTFLKVTKQSLKHLFKNGTCKKNGGAPNPSGGSLSA